MARIVSWVLVLVAGFIAARLILRLLVRERRRRYTSDRRQWWAG